MIYGEVTASGASREVTEAQAYTAARLTGLAILGSLQRELGDLDRIACWSRVFGMVNSAPGLNRQPAVINGFTDLIIEVFGAEKGAHARSIASAALKCRRQPLPALPQPWGRRT